MRRVGVFSGKSTSSICWGENGGTGSAMGPHLCLGHHFPFERVVNGRLVMGLCAWNTKIFLLVVSGANIERTIVCGLSSPCCVTLLRHPVNDPPLTPSAGWTEMVLTAAEQKFPRPLPLRSRTSLGQEPESSRPSPAMGEGSRLRWGDSCDGTCTEDECMKPASTLCFPNDGTDLVESALTEAPPFIPARPDCGVFERERAPTLIFEAVRRDNRPADAPKDRSWCPSVGLGRGL